MRCIGMFMFNSLLCTVCALHARGALRILLLSVGSAECKSLKSCDCLHWAALAAGDAAKHSPRSTRPGPTSEGRVRQGLCRPWSHSPALLEATQRHDKNRCRIGGKAAEDGRCSRSRSRGVHPEEAPIQRKCHKGRDRRGVAKASHSHPITL